MKLVNPTGRNVTEITNQANYGCCCSYVDDSYSYTDNEVGWYGDIDCSCSCAYGTTNSNANFDIGYAR